MREDAGRGNHNNNRGRHAHKRGRGSGRGLSLAAFAKAKTSTYDPRVVKERERIRASQTVNKYKKLRQRLEGGAAGAPNTQGEHVEEARSERMMAPPQARAMTHRSSLEEQRASKNGDQRPDFTRQTKTDNPPEKAAGAQDGMMPKSAEEVTAHRKEAKDKRRKEHKLFKKKTSHGQPVMKYRIEKLLDKLEHHS